MQTLWGAALEPRRRRRKDSMTTNLIAQWLAEILKPDDTGKVGVYTAAFREAWDKPPDPPGDDLSIDDIPNTESSKK